MISRRRRFGRRISLLLISITWIGFLFFFTVLAGPLGFPRWLESAVIVMIVSMLIYVVAKGSSDD